MPLPFLRKKQVAGLIVAMRKPDGDIQESHSEDSESPALLALADDLIRAVHEKNSHGVAAAIKHAFEIMEQEPHSEASPHTYDAQNEKAAE